MNDTTPPPGAPEHTPQGTFDRFFAWLRGLGIVRGNERWFAGVAGGIAAKAGIDPIIVRGIFVVLAVLGGPGILLYLAAWVLLPDFSGRIHLEDLFRGRASTGAIVAVVVLGALVVIPLIVWSLRTVFGGSWGWGAWGLMPDWLQVVFGIIWWAVLVPAGIIWLIIWLSSDARKAPRPPSSRPYESATGTPPAPPFTEQPSNFTEQSGQPAGAGGDTFSEKTAEWSEQFSQKADDWGRKVDEKSRDWEQQGREYQDKHSLGAAYVAISLALALLVGGLAAAAALALGADTGSNITLTVGLVAAVTVLACSMIIAGVRGRHSGWVGFIAFCGVVTLIFTPISTVMPAQTEFVPFGNINVRPIDQGSDRGVVSIAGNTTVDLSELSRNTDAHTIDVWLLAGNATVVLPASEPVKVQVSLLAGNVRDLRLDESDRRQGGIFVSRSFEQHTTSSNTSDVTTVRVRVLAGNIYIEDGSTGRTSSTSERERVREMERLRDREIEQLRDQIEELENAR